MQTVRLYRALIAMGSLVCGIVAQPPVLSEDAIVAAALERDVNISTARIAITSDSLALYAARGAWLPQATLSAGVSLRPSAPEDPQWVRSGSVNQALPGGGTVGASTQDFTRYTLSANQPLAAGAWRYGSPAYGLRVQKLTSAEGGARFKQTVAERMSVVRSQYWHCYEQRKSLEIAREALAQAERILVKDRARYAVGEIAVIDTLGTALSWLESQEKVISAEIAFTQAHRDLARSLDMPLDSVVVPDSIEITVAPLPPAPELLAAARAYDPDRTLFELAYEKLQLQLGQKRNTLLPQVGVSASYTVNESRRGENAFVDNSVFSLLATYALPARDRRVQIEQTRLSIEQNRLRQAQRERELADMAAMLVENWSHEQRKLVNAQTASSVAARKLDAAQKGYEVGSIDQIAFLQARKDAFDARMRALAQAVGLKKLEVTFDELTGVVFTRFGVQVQ